MMSTGGDGAEIFYNNNNHFTVILWESQHKDSNVIFMRCLAGWGQHFVFPVFSHCWLDDKKGIWHVKISPQLSSNGGNVSKCEVLCKKEVG